MVIFDEKNKGIFQKLPHDNKANILTIIQRINLLASKIDDLCVICKLDEHLKGLCGLCKKSGFLIEHHISYYPELTIYVCRSCHSKIHHGNYYPQLNPPKGESAKFYKRDNDEGSNLPK